MNYLRELRFAVRSLGRTPGISLVAVLALALGLGVSSTIFSLMDGMWFRPLPAVRDAAGLVRLFAVSERVAQESFSWPDYLDLVASARSFSGLASIQRRGPFLTIGNTIEPTATHIVSPNFFTLLGARAGLGRTFSEAAPDDAVMVISDRFWRSRFGADPGVLGRGVTLGRAAFTIVGVAPRGFRGTELSYDPDLWIPQGAWDVLSPGESKMRDLRQFDIVGRLRPGVSGDEARLELDRIATNLAAAYPGTNKGWGASLLSARQYQTLSAGSTGLLFGGLLVTVLLIACANAANLLLARGEARSREIGIRLALGSSRARLVRELLMESVLVAAAGGLLALVVAASLIAVLPAAIDLASFEFRLDQRAFAVTAILTLLAALAAGLAPAVQVSRPNLVAALRREGGAAPARARFRHALVVTQIALTMTLLVGAGLLARSFSRAVGADFGFARALVLIVRLNPRMAEAPARTFYQETLARVRALPGVKRAAYARRAPLWPSEGGMNDEIAVADQLPLRVKFNTVEPAYFSELGIPLVAGRVFDEQDGPAGTRTAIINETMARRFFPHGSPVGSLFRTHDGVDRQIVGVVRDAKINSLEESPEPYFYLPFAQDFYGSMSLLVETRGDPLVLVPAVKSAVSAIAKVPVPEFATLDGLIRARVSDRRSLAWIAGALAVVGLLLATGGLYGVMSHLVTRRTREIGVRMALGAGWRETVALVIGRALRLAAVGIAAGAATAMAASSWLSNLLYGVRAWDPPTLVGIAALLALVALMAAAVPAWRATRVDPISALRAE
jgi:predicted permease